MLQLSLHPLEFAVNCLQSYPGRSGCFYCLTVTFLCHFIDVILFITHVFCSSLKVYESSSWQYEILPELAYLDRYVLSFLRYSTP